MPNALEPKVEEWVEYLSSNINVCDENTFFVAHSLGCVTLLRYLQNHCQS